MQIYTMTEARARFCEIVAKALSGEEIMVTKKGEPAVMVARCKEAGKQSKNRSSLS